MTRPLVHVRKGSDRNTPCYRVMVGDVFVHFSYETPIAFGSYDGAYRQPNRWGPTTGRHFKDLGVYGATVIEDEDDDTRGQAIDGYQRVTVMYPDPANNYVPTPQSAPRSSPDVSANSNITLECPIPFDADTMARKADIMQKVAFLQEGSAHGMYLSGPADPALHTIRIVAAD